MSTDISTRAKPTRLAEHGFWDYTTPGAGGMEMFQKDDYLSLLEDMASAGMNSLAVSVKWVSTGYKSKLPYLDQLPGIPVIDSDNDLLRFVIEESHKRGIKFWIMTVLNYFCVNTFGGSPHTIWNKMGGIDIPFQVGLYDADDPMVMERSVEIVEEVLGLFPEIDGLVIEFELDNLSRPRRVPLYNAWAEENERPQFDDIGKPFDPRFSDLADWRDYATHARLVVLEAIEKTVRQKGFEGDFATISAPGATDHAVLQELSLDMVHDRCPDWDIITYWYDKWRYREALMDWCINRPQQEGCKVFYLPRGVMTWCESWPMPLPLETSWKIDIEDILRYKPDSVWWFGCGALNEGAHVGVSRLKELGYEDGVEARRSLLKKVKHLSD